MATSTNSAPVRPSMSAPTPLAGSSTMWASAPANSPTITSAAWRGAVPGHDPMPLAFAKGFANSLTRQPYGATVTLDHRRVADDEIDAVPAAVRHGVADGRVHTGGRRRGRGVVRRRPAGCAGRERRHDSAGPVADARDRRGG